MVSAPKTKTPMHNPFLTIANNAFSQIEKMLGHSDDARTRTKVHALGNTQNNDDDFVELR